MREIVLARYTDAWRRSFEAERDTVANALGKEVLAIEHVGSTAVPGLQAKPIVDIAIAVVSFEDAAVCVAPLEGIGYRYHGEYGIPRRHYFDRGEPHTFHIHMLEERSVEYRNHLLFRDHLRRSSAAAAEYAALKRELARRHSPDVEAYAEAKGDFVRRVVAEELRERGNPGAMPPSEG